MWLKRRKIGLSKVDKAMSICVNFVNFYIVVTRREQAQNDNTSQPKHNFLTKLTKTDTKMSGNKSPILRGLRVKNEFTE